jgi:PPK2 family polyphosphate:nucleotide phosphotransferase
MAGDLHETAAGLAARFRVASDVTVDLAEDFEPDFKAGIEKKKHGVRLLREMVDELVEYQLRLAAQETHGVLVVLQALDAAGKDGIIRHVFSGLNPAGVTVHPFKVPSAEELNHDFLWRYQQRLPARGQIAVFNRSHYEEVLVVRVHPENLDRQKIPPEAKRSDVWTRRFREINDWEHYLADNGIRVVKLLLNISKEEQRVRFLRRLDLPEHNWKFQAADIAERDHWEAYQQAFSEMLSHTSTRWAPWHVIPADHKWFARAATASVLLDTLVDIDPRYPTVDQHARGELLEAKAELEAQAPHGAAKDPVEE